jgi:hypothetical protein
MLADFRRDSHRALVLSVNQGDHAWWLVGAVEGTLRMVRRLLDDRRTNFLEPRTAVTPTSDG